MGCLGQPMKWLLCWAVCSLSESIYESDFQVLASSIIFSGEHVKVEKRGGGGRLEIGIYLSSAYVLVVRGI